MTTIVGPAVFATGILQDAGSKLCRHVKTRDARIIAPPLSHAFTDLTRVFSVLGMEIETCRSGQSLAALL